MHRLKTRRRFFQFSLRQLMLFVLLASLALSWLSVKLRHEQLEREAASKVHGLGGLVFYSHLFDDTSGTPGPSWLRYFLGDDFFMKVYGVSLPDAHNDQLAMLKDLPSLKYLELSYTLVDDEGLNHLAGLRDLEVLALFGTRVTEQGARNLRQALPSCEIMGVGKPCPRWSVGCPAVSPTGTKVAFTIHGDFGFRSIWDHVKSITGSKFASYVFGGTDLRLWILDFQSGQAYNTRARCSFGDPAWAPDESNIMFISGRSGPVSTWSRDPLYLGLDRIDLSNFRVTQVAAPWCLSAHYSPDGKRLGYVWDVSRRELVIEDLRSGAREVVRQNVNDHHWCWSPDGSKVFYLRGGTRICEMSLSDKTERVLFSVSEECDLSLGHLVLSPRGEQLGFHHLDDQWFRTIDLATGAVVRRFQCDHWSADFRWNESGICYLDKLAENRRGETKLLVYDPKTDTNTQIAAGPLFDPCWVDASRLLVRKGPRELWIYDIDEKTGSRVFPADREPPRQRRSG